MTSSLFLDCTAGDSKIILFTFQRIQHSCAGDWRKIIFKLAEFLLGHRYIVQRCTFCR